MKSNNGLQKATKIVSFLMVIVLAVFAIYFAIQSGSYVVATPTDGSEIKDITTPFGTMNPNQYALILVLISLWLFVGCVFAFLTGFEAAHEYLTSSRKKMIILGTLSLVFLAIPSGILELILVGKPREY